MIHHYYNAVLNQIHVYSSVFLVGIASTVEKYPYYYTHISNLIPFVRVVAYIDPANLSSST